MDRRAGLIRWFRSVAGRAINSVDVGWSRPDGLDFLIVVGCELGSEDDSGSRGGG